VKRPQRSLPDINTIVRYLIGDDPAQFAAAKEFFDRVKNGSVKAVFLESVIVECVYVLTKIYRVPRSRAAGSLADILRYRGVVNEDRRELIRALEMFAERSFDIVDCILFVKAQSGGDILFSFDADLKRLHDAE